MSTTNLFIDIHRIHYTCEYSTTNDDDVRIYEEELPYRDIMQKKLSVNQGNFKTIKINQNISEFFYSAILSRLKSFSAHELLVFR